MTLVEAVQFGNVGTVERLLQEGADVNELDASGWSPLSWAAAAGDISMAKLLMRFGASASLTGSDLRTPLMIALAARKPEIARFLQDSAGTNADEAPKRKYCMAVRLRELREFPGWTNANSNGGGIADTAIVYLHSDYAVTRSIWRDGEILFDRINAEWKLFCQANLKFRVPGDLELVSM